MFEQDSHTCCFLGHRIIDETAELEKNLYEILKNLIINEKVDTFLFGSKSQFDDLCHQIITSLKEKYPHIQRIYVRAEYGDISEKYENYLLESYENTYFPEKVRRAGKAAYVERNREMIDKSTFCIFYYSESYVVPTKKRNNCLPCRQPKSGTDTAYKYALKKEKTIINILTAKSISGGG